MVPPGFSPFGASPSLCPACSALMHPEQAGHQAEKGETRGSLFRLGPTAPELKQTVRKVR